LPDWVTHLGTTYIATRAAQRVNPNLARRIEMRHLLVGALLPDATRFTVVLVDVLDWPAISTFTYLIPFHSLLIIGLLSGGLAALFPAGNGSSRRAFAFLMGGAVVHYLLDDAEGTIGCGSTTFYPFYFGKPINGWSTEGAFANILLVVSAIGIGFALARKGQWPPLLYRFTRRRLAAAAMLLLVAFTIPLFFRQWMIDQNAYYLGFVTNPDAFAGQTVELCFSEVIQSQPPTVEEFDRAFVLQTSRPFEPGEWVSLRGVYQNGEIVPAMLVRHRGFSDVGLSLIAALALAVLLIDSQQLQWGQSLPYLLKK